MALCVVLWFHLHLVRSVLRPVPDKLLGCRLRRYRIRHPFRSHCNSTTYIKTGVRLLSIQAQRPKVTRGPTIKKKTGCGNIYITINADGEGSQPLEVFAKLGKSGGCSYCQNEALTAAITIGLRHGVPVGEYVSALSDVQCPSPNMWPKEERTLSCPDAIACALREYLEDHKV